MWLQKGSAQMTTALFKECSGCQKVFSASSEHFHRQKNGKYGFTSKCKDCKNKQIADWTARNPEMSRAQKMRWKNLNYDKYLQIKRDDQRRRKYNLKSGKVSVEDWNEMLKECNYSCLHCGITDDITQDHIIPLSKGGQNVIENIQPLCRSCNSSKRDKILVPRK
jgi:5-methylcytosine-specific restriction endonuclease McrA